jgi:hypothetical protein
VFKDCREEESIVNAITDMKCEGTGGVLQLDATQICWNLFVPTSQDTTLLMLDNGWDLTAEDMVFAMNSGDVEVPEGQFVRMINCFFYRKEADGLRTRRIQWVDFLPLTVKSIDEDTAEFFIQTWPDLDNVINNDARLKFPRPPSFENERLVP